MSKTRFIFLLAAALLVAVCSDRPVRSEDEAPTRAQKKRTPVRHALLVGIEEYSREKQGWSALTGPRADVSALRTALIDRAGFAPGNVHTLLDEQATHQAILTTFRNVIGAAGKNDLLLFYFSGHGSQITDDNGDEKTDGLDESLVPYDALLADGTRNDIRDDDIEKLIELANKKTSNVLLIFDSCNSGTVTRSGGPTLRSVPGDRKETTRGFGGKAKSKSTTVQRVVQPAEAKFADGMHFPKQLSYVSLGACKSNEQAAEIELPAEGGKTQVRGIFTYSLVQQLYDMKPGWSYLDLMDEVRARVRSYRNAQTPVTVGPLAHRSLFLGGAVATRPNFVLTGNEHGFRLQAGLAHGVLAGSIYSVQPSNASEDTDATRLGTIRIKQPTATSSTIQWIEISDKVKTAKQHRYRVFEVARGSGDTRLRVAVVPSSGLTKELNQDLATRIKKSYDLVLAPLNRAQLWIRAIDEDGTTIVQAMEPDGKVLPVQTSLDRGLSLFMKKLGALGAKNRILAIRKETSKSLCVNASIEKLDSERKPIGPPKREENSGIPILPVGQKFTCRLQNCSDVPVYATLLVISPDGAVAVAWKTDEGEAIPPGREVQTPVFHTEIPKGAEAFYEKGTDVFRFCVTAEPHDFSTFEQKPVTKMRTTRGSSQAAHEGALSGKEPLEDSWLTVSMEIRTLQTAPQ